MESAALCRGKSRFFSREYLEKTDAQCKESIEAKTVRVGKVVENVEAGFTSTQWFHPQCVTSRDPVVAEEIDGYDELPAHEQAVLVDAIANRKRKVAKSEGAASPTSPKKKIKKASKDAPSGDGTPAYPTYVHGLDMEEAYKKYNIMRAPELKDVLRTNKQLLGGAKAELVARCVDGEVFGALPICPACGKGRLRVKYVKVTGHNGQGEFSCPGWFDSEIGSRVSCGFTSSKVERPAWRQPGDLEPDDGAEAAKAAGGDWTKAFDDISPADKKGAAQALLAHARELRLSISKDEHKGLVDCVQRLVATRDSSEAPWKPAEALVALQKEFPPIAPLSVDDPDDGEEKGPNEDIARIFDELAHWIGILKPENYGFKVRLSL